MDVEAAVARPGEDRGRQQQAIRGNDENVERRFGERRLDRFGTEARSVPDRQPALDGVTLDRGGRRRQTSAEWTIGLREHERYRAPVAIDGG
jgi:hypothetical protein